MLLLEASARVSRRFKATSRAQSNSVAGSVGGSLGGSVGGNVAGSVGSIASGGITSASFASGAITATAIADNAIGAAELAADAVAEIQAGLATAASVTTIDDLLDTEIAAIKNKTDQLSFTVAGQLDSNVRFVNSVQVTGAGTVGTPWGPASGRRLGR